ncbi:hypothetical protein ACA910_007441 [Epithemia clementina (nom. ined.)]
MNKTSKQWAGEQPSIFEDKYRWLDIELALVGLDNMFGTYKELLDSVQKGDHLKKAPDPLKQFAAIKLLNQDTFLPTAEDNQFEAKTASPALGHVLSSPICNFRKSTRSDDETHTVT